MNRKSIRIAAAMQGARFIAPALALMLTISPHIATAQSQQGGTPAAITAPASPAAMTIEEANGLVDQVYAAWNDLKSPQAAARYYAKDPDLVFIDPSPPLMGYRGWTELQQQIQQNVTGKLTALVLRRTADVILEQRGPVAWAVFPFSYASTDRAGKRSALQGRHTIVWENRAGAWLIVHEHPSVPMAE